ncbi:hypothetical protein OC845_001282 [Tilletia horrida]|nr:hypothetical protein OC845_001282 [Tilletia horrida]
MAQNSTAESKQEADHGAFAFQMLHRIQPAKDNDPSKPRDVDPADPNRSVPTKKANQAYLVHQRYLEQQKEKQRKERIAKGLDPDVEEKVEEAGPAVIDLGLFFKRLFIGILLWAAAGFFITGSPIWGYRGKWIRMRTYFPPPPRSFTPAELQLYSGRAPDRPIYLAVMGDVYDVSSNPRIYGPGGSYSFFSGRDASRAYITGCFDDPVQLTHDLRGLSDEDMSHVLLWKKFFDNHDTYFKVGRVILPYVDPNSPPPPPCSASKS